MSRFDRQDGDTYDVSSLVSSATDEFRTTLERRVQDILETAHARAADIEQQAELRVQERERQVERDGERKVQDLRARASQILDSVELVENAVRGMLGELRTELDDSPAEQVAPDPRPLELTGRSQPVWAMRDPEAPQLGEDFVEALDNLPCPIPLEMQFDDIIESQIREMFRNGTSRADVEDFLEGFDLGDTYLQMLDELYGRLPETPASRAPRRGFSWEKGWSRLMRGR